MRPTQGFRPSCVSFPIDSVTNFTLGLSKILYLPPVPQPRHVSAGAAGAPAWVVGFVNVEQAVRIEIMHLGDS